MPMQLLFHGERARNPTVLNRPHVNALTQSGYLADGSDFVGYAKRVEPDRRATDRRAAHRGLARSLQLVYRPGQTQTVKIPEMVGRITSLQRLGDRLYGAESDVYAITGAQRRFIRFNNLDDLGDYTIAPITPTAAAPDSDSVWAMDYCAGSNRFYGMTNGGPGGVRTRLLELHPDTMAIVEKAQSFTPLSNGSTDGKVAGAIACSDTHVYVCGYNTGDLGTQSRVVAYRVSDWTAVELRINGGLRICAAQIGPDGDLFVQGEWSHSNGAAVAHAWIARIDTATLTVKQFAQIRHEFDGNPSMVIVGEFVFVGFYHDGPFCLYRIDAGDLTKQFPIHLGTATRGFVQNLSYDGRYVWATVEGTLTALPTRVIRVDPDTLEVVSAGTPDVPATYGDVGFPAIPGTFALLSDGQRLFVHFGNFSAYNGVGTPTQPTGPYMMRFAMPKALSRHYASPAAGNPVLSIGQKSFGHGRTALTPESAGMHSVGGGVRIQAIATPGAPRYGPVNSETGGGARDTAWQYFVVAVDAFDNETLPSPAGVIMGSAVLGGLSFQRVTWDHVDGAVKYYILRGNTGTKIGTSFTNAFLDDGSAVPAAYVPQTRNKTADLLLDGVLAIGTTNPAPNRMLHVVGDVQVDGTQTLSRTFTDYSNAFNVPNYGLCITALAKPTGAPVALDITSAITLIATVDPTDAFAHAQVFGVNSTITHSGSGLVSNQYGLQALCISNGTGVSNNMYGGLFTSRVDGTASVTTRAHGVRGFVSYNSTFAQAPEIVALNGGLNVSGLGAVLAYTLLLEAPLGAGPIGTLYGVLIKSHERAGSTCWPLYVEAGTSRLADLRVDGKVGFYATAPIAQPTVAAGLSRGGATVAVLADLLTKLAATGLIINGSIA